ncbi:MAG: hypothetical protein EBU07_09105 [Betaproteobacteria bacterium]|jgi:hypothetical protein|nr:hypothetical protein [Betaproteobacteria bacterium]
MQLQSLPARTGIQWVKLGIRTFFRQPLALAGLFFIFMAAMSVASLFPVVGSALALALLPAATLGLMAATAQASAGNFPMPSVLVSAFRAGRQRARAMLTLGVMYAAGFLLLMGISALIDGGDFAQLYLMGGKIDQETVSDPDFQLAALVTMTLYLPLSLLFWHAPALVHWYGVPPVKSLFFSIVACLRNFGAYLIYGITWLVVFLLSGIVITTLTGLLGSPELAAAIMLPTALLMAAMFFTSVFFTFRDTFVPPHHNNESQGFSSLA